MKKLMTLAAICLFTVSAFAQRITMQDLKGTWNIQALEMFGNHVDFVGNKITFSDGWKAENPGMDLAEVEKNMLEQMAPYRLMGFVFTDRTMALELDGVLVDEQDYSLTEKDGKQYLQSPAEPDDSPEIKFSNGLLYMDLETDDGPVTMIFKKAL